MRGAGLRERRGAERAEQSRGNGAVAHAGSSIEGVMDGSEKGRAQRVSEVFSVLWPLGQLLSSVAGGAHI
jgi:hypothetical protein